MSITINQVKQISTGARIEGIGSVANPLNVPDNGIDLNALATGTAGKVIGYDGSGNPAELDMASYSVYSAGNDGYVIANGSGVTFTKSSGELTFSIPDGIDIIGGWVFMTSGEADGSNNAYLKLNYSGTRIFNQDVARARMPIIWVSNGNTSPSRSSPNYKSNTIQIGLTAVGSNNIEMLLSGIGTLFPNLFVSFQV